MVWCVKGWGLSGCLEGVGLTSSWRMNQRRGRALRPTNKQTNKEHVENNGAVIGGRGGSGWGRHGVTPSWPMKANSGIRGHVRARQKVLEGYDRRTDIHVHMIYPLYNEYYLRQTVLHSIMFVGSQCVHLLVGSFGHWPGVGQVSRHWRIGGMPGTLH